MTKMQISFKKKKIDKSNKKDIPVLQRRAEMAKKRRRLPRCQKLDFSDRKSGLPLALSSKRFHIRQPTKQKSTQARDKITFVQK